MKVKKILIASLFLAVNALNNNASAEEHRKAPAIPSAAFAACSGKSEGDSVTDSNGMSGTCQKTHDGKLALRPNGPPPEGGERRQPQTTSDDSN